LCCSTSFFAKIARRAGISVLDSISAGKSIKEKMFDKIFKVTDGKCEDCF
jgi:hypothetical protein